MKKLNPLQSLDSILKTVNESKKPITMNEAERIDESGPSLQEINDHIQSMYGQLSLKQDGESYQWFSDDENLAKHLAKQNTSITDAGDMNMTNWVKSADDVMQGYKAPINESFDPKSYTKENATRIGYLVEYMDMNASTMDKPKLAKAIEDACNEVDPSSDLTILECFQKMGDKKAQAVFAEVLALGLDVNYGEYAEVSESVNEGASNEVTFFDTQFGLEHAAEKGIIEKDAVEPILSKIKGNRIKVEELKGILAETGKADEIVALIQKGSENSDMSESAEGMALPHSNLYLHGFASDSNGNSVVRVGYPNRRGFSVQINGDLPETKRIKGSGKKVGELTEAELATIAKEVTNYVQEHGSEEQKKTLKATVPANESVDQPDDIMAKVLEKYPLSDVLQQNLKAVIGTKANGESSATEFIDAVAAILEVSKAEVVKLFGAVKPEYLKESVKPVNEGIGAENKGGFSDAVWNQDPVKEGSAFGWVGHNNRTAELDKELEADLKGAGWDDFKIACFIMSADGRKYGDWVLENKTGADKILAKFDGGFKKEDWTNESLKVNESIDRGEKVNESRETSIAALDESVKALNILGMDASTPDELCTEISKFLAILAKYRPQIK